jgi:hypothetical protein
MGDKGRHPNLVHADYMQLRELHTVGYSSTAISSNLPFLVADEPLERWCSSLSLDVQPSTFSIFQGFGSHEKRQLARKLL